MLEVTRCSISQRQRSTRAEPGCEGARAAFPLQGKRLRFVQDRRFERVGGRETLTADIRIAAATDRQLAAMAAAGQFRGPAPPRAARSDLYFWLRVIDIEIRPLRGHDDIADLAAHFVDQFAPALPRGAAPDSRLRPAQRWSTSGDVPEQ